MKVEKMVIKIEKNIKNGKVKKDKNGYTEWYFDQDNLTETEFNIISGVCERLLELAELNSNSTIRNYMLKEFKENPINWVLSFSEKDLELKEFLEMREKVSEKEKELYNLEL